jgi:hypothetical protein
LPLSSGLVNWEFCSFCAGKSWWICGEYVVEGW